MDYIDFFRGLSEEKVRYLICGGLAVNIYGIPRMTADIDILLDFEKENILKFEKVIDKLEYKSILPFPLSQILETHKRLKLKEEKNLIAFSYFNTTSNLMSIDVLIDPPFSFEKMWSERETRALEEMTINLTSVEQLIEMKKNTGRTQDKQDIIHLSKFKK